MSIICKGFTKQRINANYQREHRPCVFAAKKDGYCVHHHPDHRRKLLEQQKRHLSESLNVVLTELIEVTALCEEIQQ